ncbi:MAG: hypothetical protein ABSC37_02490 [Xanthobacteraceae bacterium]
MTKNSRDLSDDEVRQISRVIETPNESSFDYLQIELGELKLALSKGPLQAAVPVATTAGRLLRHPLPRGNDSYAGDGELRERARNSRTSR